LKPSRHAPAAAVYFALLLVAVVVVLPSALRPPPDPATNSAEFSPDAPPDEQQDAIVAALNRGSSATPGALGDPQGTGPQAVELALEPGSLAQPPTPPAPPRSCRNGRGDPPRQVESLYAAPCAPAFVGDNGGATYQGVTDTEIRIAINGTNAGGSDPCADGKLPSEPPPGECESDRTFRVLMQYFNENFELYGRRIQYYVSQAGSTTETDVRAAAVAADDQYQVFGAGGLYAPGCQELASRKVIAMCAQLPRSEYERYHPYIWSFYPDGTELTDVTSEYMCKRLLNKPAVHAGDPLIAARKRKIGVVYFSSRGYAENGVQLVNQLRACGFEVESVAATADNQEGTAGLATAMSRFITNNVTTVVPAMDAISQIALTNVAESNGYFPEWIANGSGANTFNSIGQLMNQRQWAHAFGIQPIEAERANDLHDCYRAYRSIDPAGTPNYTVCKALYYSYLQMTNAIQLAGPELTPETFAAGLIKQGQRFYDKPVWAVGGGFLTGRHNYIADFAVLWWSTTAQDPQYLNSVGAYMYEDGAERYRPGQVPGVDRAFNPEGAVVTPPDAAEYGGP
jgi:hypothetical protein